MEIALAVVPLVIGAVKGYGSVRKRCKGMGQFPREVKHAREQFDRKYQIFLNETKLLFQAATCGGLEINEMMRNDEHKCWQSQDTELALRSLLGDSYDAYCSAITTVCTAIEDLDIDLAQYEQLSAGRKKGEKLEDTARRLGYQIKIAWSKDKFEAAIKILGELCSELKTLRKQVCQLKGIPCRQESQYSRSAKTARPTLNFESIKACKGLYHVLESALNPQLHRPNMTRTSHQVRMFIDVKVGADTVSELGVLCLCHARNDKISHQAGVVQWSTFEIRSRTLEYIDTSRPSPSSEETNPVRKRVRFRDEQQESKIATIKKTARQLLTPESSPEDAFRPPYRELPQPCFRLKQETDPLERECAYLGYIDNEDSVDPGYRHSFYHQLPASSPRAIVDLGASQNSIQEILRVPLEAETTRRQVTTAQQVRLARDIAVAFLRFYSTPWMSDYVTTKDFLYLGHTTSDMAKCLQTLHFLHTFKSIPQGCSMMDVESFDHSIDAARQDNGPRNITLWCLGTILLQIGLWQLIPNPDDVVSIRKSVSACTALGSDYQRIVEQCLECDFGQGKDLSNSRLKRAVQDAVVTELTQFIEWLERDPED